MVYGLTYCRFEELVQLAAKAREEEVKERYILAAFIGFQLGAAGKKRFGEYLRSLKLSDKPPKKSSSKAQDAMLESMGIVKQKENKK